MSIFTEHWQSECTISSSTSAIVPGLGVWENAFPDLILQWKEKVCAYPPLSAGVLHGFTCRYRCSFVVLMLLELSFSTSRRPSISVPTGAFLASPRLLRSNQLLNLTIPAPPSPSSMVPAETPPIQARVRRHHATGGIHMLGVEFLKALE
jgi:hypothetical protein